MGSIKLQFVDLGTV